MKIPRVYLAGPDVFFRNSESIFRRMQQKCAEVGLAGVAPTDGGLSQGIRVSKPEMAERIYVGNMEIIQSCDGILANLMPFRTAMEPDSGTVFEVGVGVALGKSVCGYLPLSQVALEDKVKTHFGVENDENGVGWDKDYGYMVEAFEQPMNLMLSRSVDIFETFDQALEKMAQVLLKKSTSKS